MKLWEVKLTANCEAELRISLKNKEISKTDISIIKAWLNEMEQFGPEYIAKSSRWTDHPLEREWRGYRASCYSMLGRIIYKIENKKIIVEVARVTPDHNYRK